MEEIKKKINNVFECFQLGDWDTAEKNFDVEKCLIYTKYGPPSKAITWKEFVKMAKFGPLQKLGNPIYLNRSLEIIDSTSHYTYIEKHDTQLTIFDKKIVMPCLIIGKIDKHSKKIISLEEYLDPSPLAKAMMKGQQKTKPIDLTTKTKLKKESLNILITGASSGIGEEMAYEYAKMGNNRIGIAGRREKELIRVASNCQKINSKCEILVLVVDLQQEEEIIGMMEKVKEKFIHLDRLYLNAGVSQSAYLIDQKDSTALRGLMNTNFFGSANTVRVALPLLIKAASPSLPSRISVISSVLGKVVAPKNSGYCASKWSLHGFFESLRLEIAKSNITVTMVCPGPVDTPILSNLYGSNGSVALIIDKSQRDLMTTANEAARLSINATEEGERELIFPEQLKKIALIRAANPEKVDAIMFKMYSNMGTHSTNSKL